MIGRSEHFKLPSCFSRDKLDFALLYFVLAAFGAGLPRSCIE